MDLQNEKKLFLKKFSNPEVTDIEKMSFQYALFLANMKRFLPEMPKENYKSFFLDLQYHRWLSKKEQYDLELLHHMKIINSSSFNIETPNQCKNIIFATFHLGPFRLFNCFLLERGFKIALIVDHNVYLSQGEELINEVLPLLNNSGKADLIVLDVKDKKSIFRLKELISNGYVISVYLDGNTGITRIRSNEFDNSFIQIVFFNNKVNVKYGIGRLALLLGLDIIPVISYRDKNENPVVYVNKEIKISDFQDRKTYPQKVIEHLFSLFEKKLAIHKNQWVDWVFIHQWFKRGARTPYTVPHTIMNIFNEDRYALFIKDKCHYLFDLYDYISYPIDSELYEQLNKNNISSIKKDWMAELVEKNIII